MTESKIRTQKPESGISKLKTDFCSVCYEKSPIILQCNHCVCRECIGKHFKQECPVCRKPHVFPVSGKVPIDTPKKGKRSLMEIYTEMRNKQKEEERIFAEKTGYESDGSQDVKDSNSDCADYDY